MTTEPNPPKEELILKIDRMTARNEGEEVALLISMESRENPGNRESRTLVLTMEQYCELKPRRGLITAEYFDALETAAKLSEAVRCGRNLLSWGFSSRSLLTRKIMRHGFDREVAEKAAERLSERGMVDEEKELPTEVRKCLRKLWGRNRIRAYLVMRGYAKETVDLLDRELDEVDFAEQCRRLIEKHYGGLPINQEEMKKMTAGLSRYGYTLGEIREAIQQMQNRERE